MPEQNVEMQADVELQAAFEPHTLQGEPVWTCANDYSTASAAFTCSECGETQTFDAAVTSEASGKKTVYTAAVTVNGVEYTDSKTVFHNDFGEDLAGCTLSLGDDIGVNFFMELSEEVVESPNAKMVFTVENGEGKAPQELLVSDIVKNDLYSTAGDSTYYIFSCHVAAKEMNTTIKAQIIDGEEDGDIYEYTVKDYAKTIITDTAGRYSDSTKALVKAMVNYGTAAQTQFGFNTDNPVNLILEESDRVTAPLTEIEKGEITAHNKQITADIKNVNDVTYIGSQLVLLSNTTYRMYFSSGLDKYTVMYNDEEIDPAVSGNSRTITISDISPNQLFEDISLKLTPKSGNAEPVNISLNAADYYYFALKLPTDDSVSNEKAAENSRLINTVTALYRYYNAACDYVSDNS